jgi:dTDP-L-rhamnose 4-epimerase
LKVLVTGGAGFIGSHLVDLLVDHRHETTVLDNLDPQVHGNGATEPRHLGRHVQSGAVRFIRGDVTHRPSLEQAMAGAEAVVHLAAVVGVGQSMYQPYYYVHNNATGTALLLDVAVGLRDSIRKLIVASSMSLYGEGLYRCPACGNKRGLARDAEQLSRGCWEVLCVDCRTPLQPQPTPEHKTADIASIYAATKKHQEDLFVAFGRAYGIPTFALRLFNVIGPRQSLGNPYTGVAAIFLSRLLNDQPPLVFEDGLQSRDLIDVRDVARAFLLALEFSGKGTHVLNVGTGRPMTVVAVATALARQLGKNIPPETLHQYRAGDVRHCYADPSLARQVLGFEALFRLEETLPGLITWCRREQAADRFQSSLVELRERGLVR